MQLNKKCRFLVSEIYALFNDGIKLSSNVLHYIDSTFAYPTIRQIEQILSDKDNCESDVLSELIFYPDVFIQVRFEKILEENRFLKNDEINILRYFSNKSIATKLCFPDDKGILNVQAGGSVIKSFINRLNIKKQVNKKVLDAVNRNVNFKLKQIVKVYLRNTFFLFTDNRVDFLCGFFKSSITKESNFIQYLQLSLSYLEEIGHNEEMCSYLKAKKIKYLQEIEKTRRFLLQLKKYNIETMMMQNINMPVINVEDAKETIVLIDKIISMVFNSIARIFYKAPISDIFKRTCPTTL